MMAHERRYNVNGKSVNLEKFRIHILQVIENDSLSISKIASILETEHRKLQGVLYNMHAAGLVNVDKESKVCMFSKVKASMLQDIFHPMPDFSDRIKSIYIHSGEE